MDEMERLYSLQEAVDAFFPGGIWTVASLRTEIRKGRLKPMRIAGKFAVTESAIREMRRLCQEKPNLPGSISDQPEMIERPSGSFSTGDAKLAQDAAKASVRKLRERLRTTSRKNTKSPKQADDLIELSSRMSSTSM